MQALERADENQKRILFVSTTKNWSIFSQHKRPSKKSLHVCSNRKIMESLIQHVLQRWRTCTKSLNWRFVLTIPCSYDLLFRVHLVSITVRCYYLETVKSNIWWSWCTDLVKCTETMPIMWAFTCGWSPTLCFRICSVLLTSSPDWYKSRRFSMCTRGRVTTSWLPTSRPSRARQSRLF